LTKLIFGADGKLRCGPPPPPSTLGLAPSLGLGPNPGPGPATLTPTLNLAPTPTPTPTPTLPTLALTRWDYLEALVENAAASSEYNILGATEGLASFLLSPAGSPLQEALADALVAEFDSLGAEALTLLI
jgi:hypothetical protein